MSPYKIIDEHMLQELLKDETETENLSQPPKPDLNYEFSPSMFPPPLPTPTPPNNEEQSDEEVE